MTLREYIEREVGSDWYAKNKKVASYLDRPVHKDAKPEDKGEDRNMVGAHFYTQLNDRRWTTVFITRVNAEVAAKEGGNWRVAIW